MSREQRDQLLAEHAAVVRLLADTPAEDAVDRVSLQGRLGAIEERLATLPADGRAPARVVITFSGRPVIGTRGVFVDFAMEATNGFSDLVAAMIAANDRDLAPTGPIPGRADARLLITSTAVGSFGFALEEHREAPLLVDDGATARAIASAQTLLASTTGTDDELTEAAAGLDPRVLGTARAFISTLAKGQAICTVRSDAGVTSFRDVAQVQRAVDRLAEANRHEAERRLFGSFQGMLPKSCDFEFVAEPDGVVIRGKVGAGAGDPRTINQHLGERVEVTLVETRIGSGRPRYLLKDVPEWGTASDVGPVESENGRGGSR